MRRSPLLLLFVTYFFLFATLLVGWDVLINVMMDVDAAAVAEDLHSPEGSNLSSLAGSTRRCLRCDFCAVSDSAAHTGTAADDIISAAMTRAVFSLLAGSTRRCLHRDFCAVSNDTAAAGADSDSDALPDLVDSDSSDSEDSSNYDTAIDTDVDNDSDEPSELLDSPDSSECGYDMAIDTGEDIDSDALPELVVNDDSSDSEDECDDTGCHVVDPIVVPIVVTDSEVDTAGTKLPNQANVVVSRAEPIAERRGSFVSVRGTGAVAS